MPRVFPHDLEAERSLLGSMLISKEACQDILNKCEDRDFYEESHKVLFNAMSELSRQNIPVDVTTITSYLLDHSQLDKVGGVEYLRQLSDSVPTLAHSEYYLKIIHNKSILRKIINETTKIAENAFGDIEDIDGFIDESEKTMLAITRDRNAGEFVDVKKVIREVIAMVILVAAILLLMLTFFFDYIKAESNEPQAAVYEMSENEVAILKEKQDYDESQNKIVLSSAHKLDESDLQQYKTTSQLQTGQSNPFDEVPLTDIIYDAEGNAYYQSVTSRNETNTTSTKGSVSGISSEKTTDNSTKKNNSNIVNNSVNNNSNNVNNNTVYEPEKDITAPSANSGNLTKGNGGK